MTKLSVKGNWRIQRKHMDTWEQWVKLHTESNLSSRNPGAVRRQSYCPYLYLSKKTWIPMILSFQVIRPKKHQSPFPFSRLLIKHTSWNKMGSQPFSTISHSSLLPVRLLQHCHCLLNLTDLISAFCLLIPVLSCWVQAWPFASSITPSTIFSVMNDTSVLAALAFFKALQSSHSCIWECYTLYSVYKNSLLYLLPTG